MLFNLLVNCLENGGISEAQKFLMKCVQNSKNLNGPQRGVANFSILSI